VIVAVIAKKDGTEINTVILQMVITDAIFFRIGVNTLKQ
jgi:hypothetical protein